MDGAHELASERPRSRYLLSEPRQLLVSGFGPNHLPRHRRFSTITKSFQSGTRLGNFCLHRAASA
eukprot:5788247-Pyramimonas_sp.AAC.1